MSASQITRMANQIAEAFALQDEAEAVASIADHIEHFWDPRMRAQLRAVVESGGTGLSERALQAARRVVADHAPA